jgi:hypothetical protein
LLDRDPADWAGHELRSTTSMPVVAAPGGRSRWMNSCGTVADATEVTAGSVGRAGHCLTVVVVTGWVVVVVLGGSTKTAACPSSVLASPQAAASRVIASTAAAGRAQITRPSVGGAAAGPRSAGRFRQ